MKFMSRAENLCAAGLIIFFFFPWVNFGGFISIAGYELPDITKGIAHFVAAADQATKVNPQVNALYLIYIIPISSLLTIILGVTDKSTKEAGLVAGLAPIATLAYFVTHIGTTTFEHMASGAWLTLLTAITMLMAVFDIIKMPTETPASDS